MSSLKVHTIQSVATSAALYPVIGANVIPFGLTVILVDLDHVVEYVMDIKSLDLRGVFPYAKLVEKNLEKNYLVLHAFHTLEFFLMIMLMAAAFPWLYYVLAGGLYHMLVDFVHLLKQRMLFARVFSIVEYFYRRRNKKYRTSIKELVNLEDLDKSENHNIDSWLLKWGLAVNEK